MGKDDATEKEIEEAASNANALTFINDLPKVRTVTAYNCCNAPSTLCTLELIISWVDNTFDQHFHTPNCNFYGSI